MGFDVPAQPAHGGYPNAASSIERAATVLLAIAEDKNENPDMRIRASAALLGAWRPTVMPVANDIRY